MVQKKAKQHNIAIGIDVAQSRGCAVAAVDDCGSALGVTWTRSSPRAVRDAVSVWSKQGAILGVGIDAPRMPLLVRRAHYWNGQRRVWRACRPDDSGYGRHCEVVIAALRLASPQWTPFGAAVPDWMALGFRLYRELQQHWPVFEVFPSASYEVLKNDSDVRLTLSFQEFASNPKDVLDAYIGAVTVREFLAGRGCKVGGGDGLGEIILPRAVEAHSANAVHAWPTC